MWTKRYYMSAFIALHNVIPSQKMCLLKGGKDVHGTYTPTYFSSALNLIKRKKQQNSLPFSSSCIFEWWFICISAKNKTAVQLIIELSGYNKMWKEGRSAKLILTLLLLQKKKKISYTNQLATVEKSKSNHLSIVL